MHLSNLTPHERACAAANSCCTTHAWQVFVGVLLSPYMHASILVAPCLPYLNHRPAGFIRKVVTNFQGHMGPYTSFDVRQRMYKALSKPQHQTAIVQAMKGYPKLNDDDDDGSYVVHLTPAGVPFRDPPSSEAELKRVVAGVLRGLAALHEEGACCVHGLRAALRQQGLPLTHTFVRVCVCVTGGWCNEVRCSAHCCDQQVHAIEKARQSHKPYRTPSMVIPQPCRASRRGWASTLSTPPIPHFIGHHATLPARATYRATSPEDDPAHAYSVPAATLRVANTHIPRTGFVHCDVRHIKV